MLPGADEPTVSSGTPVRLVGRAPASRVVIVQKRTGSRWKDMARVRATSRGRFVVCVEARRKMVLRAVTRTPVSSRSGRPDRVAIPVVRQRGTLSAIPPLAAPGPTPQVPTAAAQVLATFTPPAPGGTVLLQKRTASGWRTVATGEQNLAGAVAFDAKPGTVYRAASSPTSITRRVVARRFEEKFADDFTTPAADGRSPDPTRWSDQFRVDVPARTCSTNSPTARDIAGGVLNLRALLDASRTDPCSYSSPVKNGPFTTPATGTSPWLLNSQVGTPKTFSFTYGYAAARMRMHSFPGAHAAFWLLPTKTVPDDMPEWHDVSFTEGDPSRGAEIDVAEYWAQPRPGDEEPDIGSFVHWYGPGHSYQSLGGMKPEADLLRPEGNTWDDDFHVFAVRWSPEAYEFMVDGQVYYRETGAISHAPQYLVLSMLSSNYEIGRATPDLFSDAAEVDWVRVWGL